jgi:hypothetical protein
MPSFKSILKPENSVLAGIATAGSVWAIYQMNVGSTVNAHASDANHPALESSRKKAGYMSFIFVSGITLITRDANVGLLGFASIIAVDVTSRHAIMSNPVTNMMEPPAGSGYEPSSGGQVIDFANAGASAPMTGYTG